MKESKEPAFLDHFPNHVYRYIDQTGNGRPPQSSAAINKKLNYEGYESYFTVNGFSDFNKATRENLTTINAFFLDIDGRKDAGELAAISNILEPTFVIETMRGYHAYWLLDEPIYKNEHDDFDELLSQWEKIEQSIVTTLNGDPAVKDVTRILRVPGTYYWKKSGNDYLKGVTNAPFKVKGIHKNVAARYSMNDMTEAFPQKALTTAPVVSKKSNEDADDFFARVNNHFPMEKRDYFNALVSGTDIDAATTIGRNSLLIAAVSLMKQAGWTQQMAIEHITKTGWYGLERENGGPAEIQNTVASAFKNSYSYTPKHPLVSKFITPEDQKRLNVAYFEATKERKDIDKIRFSDYETVLAEKYPNIRINDVGMVFVYSNGVYEEAQEDFLLNTVLESMHEDALFGYRTRNHAKDKIACWMPRIAPLALNDDENILNVKNGLLNIRTLELSQHTPSYVSLYQMPVSYDKNATCPTWEKCLFAWTSGDYAQEKTKVLQEYSGYTLTSSMRYAKMLILVGDGGNGKSTFADTISMLVGKKGTAHISLETLEKNFGPSELLGKRLNVVEEISGNFYHSHILKKIVSGEEVTTDKKYYSHFTFKPTAKFIFAVNEMPRVDDSSQATERRMLVVLFNNNFRDNPNTDLRFDSGLLAQELPGILNWALAGAKSLREAGKFTETEEHKVALQDYREENSSADAFITECLEFKEGELVEAGACYEMYKIYCIKGGLKPWSQIRFTKYFKALALRIGRFSFLKRENNREQNKFEGFRITENWSKYSLDDYGHITIDLLKERGF